MKACLLAALSLLVTSSSSTAQPPYTEKQVIAYAKSIDVKMLDPSLPSQRLEDWLQSGPPHAHILFWEMDATCDLKPDDSSEDYPLCAEVRVTHDGQFGFILVQVGTLNKGIVGPPSIYRGVRVEETWEIVTGSSERLSDLPSLLNQPAFTGGVRQLYEEIVAHHPIGIPSGAEMAAIRPFLSKRLSEQLQTAKACQEDYFQQHQIIEGAPKPTWLKMGIFSGDGKRALPVESYPSLKERPTDGTFLVDMSLSLPDINGHKPKFYSRNDWWIVAVKVISENGDLSSTMFACSMGPLRTDPLISSWTHSPGATVLTGLDWPTRASSTHSRCPSGDQALRCVLSASNLTETGFSATTDSPQNKLAQKRRWLQWNAATECNIIIAATVGIPEEPLILPPVQSNLAI